MKLTIKDINDELSPEENFNCEVVLGFFNDLNSECQVKGKNIHGFINSESTATELMNFFECLEELKKDYYERCNAASKKENVINFCKQDIDTKLNTFPDVKNSKGLLQISMNRRQMLANRVWGDLVNGKNRKLLEYSFFLCDADVEKKKMVCLPELFYYIGLGAAYERFLAFLETERLNLDTDKLDEEEFDLLNSEDKIGLTHKLVALDALGILEFTKPLVVKSENERPNFRKWSEIIAKITGERQGSIEAVVKAIFNDTAKNPYRSENNVLLKEELKRKFGQVQEKKEK